MIKENLKSFINLKECGCGKWRQGGKNEDARFLVEGGLAYLWLEGADMAEPFVEIQPSSHEVSLEFLGKSLLLKRKTRIADILEAGGYRQDDRSSIRLQQREAWKLAVDGGLSDSTFNLAALVVKEVMVWGGARKSIFVLPDAEGDIHLTIEGGCEACLFLLPPERRCIFVTRGKVESTEFGPDTVS